MLTKLLKYEIKTTSRMLLPIGGGVLVFNLLTGILTRLMGGGIESDALNWLYALVAFLAVLGIVVIIGACFFVNIQSFYKILGDQGYTMFSLPVPAWQHITAKLLCTLMWCVLCVPYLILCFGLMLMDFSWLSGFLMVSNTDPKLLLICVLLLLLALLGVAVMFLHAYLCCAIGAQFGQQRLLASIISYFVLGFVQEILFVILVGFISFGSFQGSSWFLAPFFHLLVNDPILASIIMLAAINIFLVLIGAIFWAVTQWLITRRLNLV